MRGKDEFHMKNDDKLRITPAYAGKSYTPPLTRSTLKDHPRLCGEKQVEMVDADTLKGSPPPMRGKVAVKCALSQVDGITPAYAGKSAQNTSL